MPYAPPARFKEEFYRLLEKEIKDLFRLKIYLPIVELFGEKVLKNAKSDLFESISSGRLEYVDGYLSGKVNLDLIEQIRFLGGRYDKTRKAWYLPDTTPELQIAKAQADAKYTTLQRQILQSLDQVQIDWNMVQAGVSGRMHQSMNRMNQEITRTLKGIAVSPKITPEGKKFISDEWGGNLTLYIQKFTDENILKLRQEVQAHAFSGGRSASLAKVIQQNYGVSQRKAKFLARQETSLLMSTVRENRYKDVGSIKYKWSGAMDSRERHDHKLLQGKVFFWDSPPVVDRNTGRRANPGEDYNCRCVAIPVFD